MSFIERVLAWLFSTDSQRNEKKKNDFRIMVSYVRSDLGSLIRTSESINNLLHNALIQGDKNKIIKYAKRKFDIDLRKECLEKVKDSLVAILDSWAIFSEDKAAPIIAQNIAILYSNINFIQQPEVVEMIRSLPTPTDVNYVQIREPTDDEVLQIIIDWMDKSNIDQKYRKKVEELFDIH